MLEAAKLQNAVIGEEFSPWLVYDRAKRSGYGAP
jgi:hypothetical protein